MIVRGLRECGRREEAREDEPTGGGVTREREFEARRRAARVVPGARACVAPAPPRRPESDAPVRRRSRRRCFRHSRQAARDRATRRAP